MNSREVLEQEIKQLEEQLKARKLALRALTELEIAQGIQNSPATRFAGMRPTDAIVEVLRAVGKPMPAKELSRILDEGGINIGKKRSGRFSLAVKVNSKLGTLTRSGKGASVGDGEIIGLGEWSKKK